MTVMSNEDPEDPSAHEPRVTGAPEAIWLVYGELEHDDTHAACADSGEVTWCEDAQFPADVRYTRTDRVGELVAAAVAAERERLLALAKKRADYEASAAAHHAGQWHVAHEHHMKRHAAIRDLIDVLEGPND